jgi:predicted O-linked N-acetylglucosamine transferase (SPINDLY family)
MQICWLGYLATLGASWYDYIITDRFITPEDQQPFFAERFLYLPNCYCPSDTKREVASVVPGRDQCGLPRQGFVFSCFNTHYKILPALFDVWMRLLAQIADSVLWLSPANATTQDNLRREAAARGVDARRLVFAPRVSPEVHLARHIHADLFLDTVPYNAGTTANNALFMGLPVVTCAGETMVSRFAGSQLRAIGMPQLVTSNLDDYEALALELAHRPEILAGYRTQLAANRITHPLFDMARFIAALEDQLIAAWRQPRHHATPSASAQ